MHKAFFVFALLSVSAFAEAEPGRWLPKGEERPSLIERVYTSPAGDLEFTRTGESHSVLLRNARGGLAEMIRLSGAVDCDQWFISDKSEALPKGCEFQFVGPEGGAVSVRSDEMEESNLFRAVSGRGRYVAF